MQDSPAGTVLLGDREREGARPDADILRDVQHALDEDASLQPFRDHMSLAVRDGLVMLAGHVRTPRLRNTAANLAWSVIGVEGVLNGLVDDWRLRVEVVQALSRDPRLHGLALQVQSDLGAVRLSGRVHAATVRPQVAEVVRGVHGVVSVDVRNLETWREGPSTQR